MKLPRFIKKRKVVNLVKKQEEEVLPMLVIEDHFNDDWMKSLPGYEDEVEITRKAKTIKG